MQGGVVTGQLPPIPTTMATPESLSPRVLVDHGAPYYIVDFVTATATASMP